MFAKLERMIRGVVSRAIVNSGDKLLQVLWLDDRVSADVEYMEPQGVHFRPPANADGVLLAPSGNTSASVLLNAQSAVPGDAVAPGEGGLHYLGAYRVFCRADGTLALGAYDPGDGVGVDALIEARLSELKLAIDNALAAITAPGGGPAVVAAFAAAFAAPGPGLPGPFWPSPTGSGTVKVSQ